MGVIKRNPRSEFVAELRSKGNGSGDVAAPGRSTRLLQGTPVGCRALGTPRCSSSIDSSQDRHHQARQRIRCRNGNRSASNRLPVRVPPLILPGPCLFQRERKVPSVVEKAEKTFPTFTNERPRAKSSVVIEVVLDDRCRHSRQSLGQMRHQQEVLNRVGRIGDHTGVSTFPPTHGWPGRRRPGRLL